MQFSMSFFKSFMRSLFGKIATYIVRLALGGDSDAPPTSASILLYMLDLKDSAISMFVSMGNRIARILGRCSNPKIAPSVIRRIVIYMVDVSQGPFASHIGPNYLMCPNALIFDRNSYSAFFGFARTASYVPGTYFPVGDLPSENPCFTVIGEIFPDKRWVESWHSHNVHQASTVHKT